MISNVPKPHHFKVQKVETLGVTVFHFCFYFLYWWCMSPIKGGGMIIHKKKQIHSACAGCKDFQMWMWACLMVKGGGCFFWCSPYQQNSIETAILQLHDQRVICADVRGKSVRPRPYFEFQFPSQTLVVIE